MLAKENACVNETNSSEDFLAEKYETDVERVANRVCKSIRRSYDVYLEKDEVCNEVWLSVFEVVKDHGGLDCERCIRLALHATRKRLVDQNAKYIERSELVDFQSIDEPQDSDDPDYNYSMQQQIYGNDGALWEQAHNYEDSLICNNDKLDMYEYLIDNEIVTEDELYIKQLYSEGHSFREIGEMLDISKDTVKRRLVHVEKQIENYLNNNS